MLQGRFDRETFTPAVVAVAESLVPASVDLWKRVQAKMLPTPAKFHYQFNMRDLSKASMLPGDMPLNCQACCSKRMREDLLQIGSPFSACVRISVKEGQ